MCVCVCFIYKCFDLKILKSISCGQYFCTGPKFKIYLHFIYLIIRKKKHVQKHQIINSESMFTLIQYVVFF